MLLQINYLNLNFSLISEFQLFARLEIPRNAGVYRYFSSDGAPISANYIRNYVFKECLELETANKSSV